MAETIRSVNASLSVDTFKLYKQTVLKFNAFCEQYNFNTLWLPNMDNNFNLIAYLFPEGYS